MQRLDPRVVEILAPLWLHVVGNGIAQHSRPIAFQSGVLKLATSCPASAVQMRRMSEEIRATINRYLGPGIVKKVSVRYNSKLALPDQQYATRACLPGTPAAPETSAPRRQFKPCFEPSRPKAQGSGGDVQLDPEVARILEQSFKKYFSRSAGGKSWSNA